MHCVARIDFHSKLKTLFTGHNNVDDSRSACAIYEGRASWAQKKVGRERGRGSRWTAVVLYHAPRDLFYPVPDNDKMPVSRYIFSRSDDPSFEYASQHAISARYAMVCTRPNTVQGCWMEGLWKPLCRARCWILLMLLGPSLCCCRTDHRHSSAWYESPRLSAPIQRIETRSGYV